MNRKLTGLLCSAILFVSGCAPKDITSVSTSVTSSQNEVTEKKLSDEYTNLDENNHFTYGEKENLKSFIEHGTGILFLGFPECPWCQAYVPMLEEKLSENDVSAVYYNIYVDKSADRPYYDEIAETIQSVNETGEEILHYNNEGQTVIYMPLVLFIENGKIVAFDGESNDQDSNEISPEEYWTEEKISSLKDKLGSAIAHTKQVMDENDAKGCDDGCSYGE